MKRIREIFLTQYIGAIVIGMLVVQAAVGTISLVIQPIIWYTQNRDSRSVMSGLGPFPWLKMLPTAITVALYVIVCYMLLGWLYRTEERMRDDGESANSTIES